MASNGPLQGEQLAKLRRRLILLGNHKYLQAVAGILTHGFAIQPVVGSEITLVANTLGSGLTQTNP